MNPAASGAPDPVSSRALVFVDAVWGHLGSYDEWVTEFARKWQAGRASAETFMDLMGPEIRLVAPGLRPTVGRMAGTEAFRRAFAVMPDLTATVHGWAQRGDRLFIEMTFEATVGGRRMAWPNVDRFVFADGYAVERAAYFNPMKIRSAFLRSPAGWVQLARRHWVRL